MPLHLLPHPRHSLGAQQFRNHSTFLGRRTYQSARLVRYYIGPATSRQYKYERTPYPRRIKSTRTRRLAEYLRLRLVDCHRAFATHPISRRDYGWTDEPVEVLRAQAESEQQPLTHLDKTGAARMVEITGKAETKRVAIAVATLLFSNSRTYDALCSQQVVKGNAEAVSRLAAIQAAKKTSDLVPLAHPSIGITAVNVDVDIFGPEDRIEIHKTYRENMNSSELWSKDGGVIITSTVKCQGRTGVEMEALTASTIGAVTMYDMLKAIDKGMVIMGARVIQKEGGKSGNWMWDEKENKYVPFEKLEPTYPIREEPVPEQSPQAFPSQELLPTKTEPAEVQTSSSDIDEWNQGLSSEFSVSESTPSSTDKQKASRAIQVAREGRKINGKQSSAQETSTNTTSKETTMNNQVSTNKHSKVPKKPQSEPSPYTTEYRTIKNIQKSIKTLEFRLLSIQKSKFVQKMAESQATKDEGSDLDTPGEWHPYRMSRISRDDISAQQHKVDGKDFQAQVKKRYEEQGGGSGGSIIR